ncbi:hypothetical protein HDV05_004419 [Chytridiales sp. JEL 0842]|nr:hypothetical protein HDV05_004419 [Chytridiales sp. JEL 0842]
MQSALTTESTYSRNFTARNMRQLKDMLSVLLVVSLAHYAIGAVVSPKPVEKLLSEPLTQQALDQIYYKLWMTNATTDNSRQKVAGSDSPEESRKLAPSKLELVVADQVDPAVLQVWRSNRRYRNQSAGQLDTNNNKTLGRNARRQIDLRGMGLSETRGPFTIENTQGIFARTRTSELDRPAFVGDISYHFQAACLMLQHGQWNYAAYKASYVGKDGRTIWWLYVSVEKDDPSHLDYEALQTACYYAGQWYATAIYNQRQLPSGLSTPQHCEVQADINAILGRISVDLELLNFEPGVPQYKGIQLLGLHCAREAGGVCTAYDVQNYGLTYTGDVVPTTSQAFTTSEVQPQLNAISPVYRYNWWDGVARWDLEIVSGGQAAIMSPVEREPVVSKTANSESKREACSSPYEQQVESVRSFIISKLLEQGENPKDSEAVVDALLFETAPSGRYFASQSPNYMLSEQNKRGCVSGPRLEIALKLGAEKCYGKMHIAEFRALALRHWQMYELIYANPTGSEEYCWWHSVFKHDITDIAFRDMK